LLAALKDRNALFVCPVRFTHPANQFLCGFPVRSRQGPISWPRQGAGIYWSPEIRSARRLGASVELLGGWLYEKRCDCKEDWVNEVYAARLALGKGSRGLPIKLGLNATYGKRVQRVGAKTYANHVHGSLITSHVRAWINDAIRTAGPRNVIMIAADSVFTVKQRPNVTIDSEKLGAWTLKTYDNLFIVQPGLYWPEGGKLKTRGISPKFFEKHVDAFEEAWLAWCEQHQLRRLFAGRPLALSNPPTLGVPIKAFISLRLAYRLNKPDLAARWLDLTRRISFGWSTKRCFEGLSDDGMAAVLGSLAGDPDQWSVSYDEQGKRTLPRLVDGQLVGGELLPSDMKEFMEAMPDPVDFDPPFTE